MARYEFKFVVTDTQLSDEHQQKVGRAVAEAGALAVASATPPDAVTVRYALNHWWCGLPPVDIREALEAVATQRATEDVGSEAI